MAELLVLERHQVVLYLVAIGLGVVVGLTTATAAPAVAPALEVAITPVLGLLLYATFLGIPLHSLRGSFTDRRFIGTVLVVNFAIAPLVAFGLSRFVADDDALLIGVVLVLVTPCIDYVIVFAGLAGGAKEKLLAATPLLMLVQVLLLPLYLYLFVGGETAATIEIEPFAEAFVALIVIPLVAAAITQGLARRHRAARVSQSGALATMVPLMMLTLAVVVGSQVARVGSELGALARVIPLYVVFLVVMVGVGVLAGRVSGADAPTARTITFSGATRNSLVVLPLALALPESLALAPLAVVAQTLVELVGMVVLVRVLPRLIPERRPART